MTSNITFTEVTFQGCNFKFQAFIMTNKRDVLSAWQGSHLANHNVNPRF